MRWRGAMLLYQCRCSLMRCGTVGEAPSVGDISDRVTWQRRAAHTAVSKKSALPKYNDYTTRARHQDADLLK